MALLSEALKEKIYDVRMIKRGISNGKVSREELNKSVQSLKDDSENADITKIDVLLESLSKKPGHHHSS